MSEQEYTPTTEEVRMDFAYPWEGFKQDKPARLAAFDRWLAAHDAEQQRIGAVAALHRFIAEIDKSPAVTWAGPGGVKERAVEYINRIEACE